MPIYCNVADCRVFSAFPRWFYSHDTFFRTILYCYFVRQSATRSQHCNMIQQVVFSLENALDCCSCPFSVSREGKIITKTSSSLVTLEEVYDQSSLGRSPVGCSPTRISREGLQKDQIKNPHTKLSNYRSYV